MEANRSTKVWCALLLLLTLNSLQGFAQQGATISGSVRDNQGALPGATVFLTGTKFIVATDLSGNF